jgi:nitrogen-specific signal transduction histidine kinase
MRIYEQKFWWKRALLLVAITIGSISLWYTNQLVELLAREELKKIKLWASATQMLVNSDYDAESNLDFYLDIIRDNETIPVILIDENGEILDYRNLDTSKASKPGYLRQQLEEMKSLNEPILIAYDEEHNKFNYLYYKNSVVLTRLKEYPYYQLTIIALFVLVAYFAFSASRKAEQNRVWVGMSKETAHQLGTPISSLHGWIQLLRDTDKAEQELILNELLQDVQRLEMITERFSKIGSAPVLHNTNLYDMISHFVSYFKNRTSSKVAFDIVCDDKQIHANINTPLMEWVIENICKNAVDAMNGEGLIQIQVSTAGAKSVIDISDNGRGIPKGKLKTVFKPGFTTKKRGWGLGLSLVKRIVEEYHKGKVYVKESSPEKGTTFRITI